MGKSKKPRLLIILVCVAALAALIGAGLLLSSSASHSSALNGEPSSVPTAHALPSLSPSSAAIPTSGPVTYVRAGQWTSTKDQANGGASITLAFYVTVVPGDDLSSGTLTFASHRPGRRIERAGLASRSRDSGR